MDATCSFYSNCLLNCQNIFPQNGWGKTLHSEQCFAVFVIIDSPAFLVRWPFWVLTPCLTGRRKRRGLGNKLWVDNWPLLLSFPTRAPCTEEIGDRVADLRSLLLGRWSAPMITGDQKELITAQNRDGKWVLGCFEGNDLCFGGNHRLPKNCLTLEKNLHCTPRHRSRSHEMAG